MKILFLGLGSAGQRHLRNIRRILGDQAELSAVRVRKLNWVFDDNLQVVPAATLQDKYPIKEYDNLSDAFAQKPDITIIANPNSMHIECAVQAAKAGSHIFIEKPLSNTLDGIDELKHIARKNKLKVYVGFQNRFHPCIQKLKELIDSSRLGHLISIHCEIGELLSNMHSYEDYRGMNESRKETGGGVVLCQIHELDYLYWMLGLPEELYAAGGKNSHMDIDVEDHAITCCRYRREDYTFPVIIQQDFIQSPPVRRCKVVGEYGRVEIDLLKNTCTLYFTDQKTETYHFSDFNRNDMFLEEMRRFLDSVKTGRPEFVDIDSGCGSLKLALAIKESIETQQIIRFNYERG